MLPGREEEREGEGRRGEERGGEGRGGGMGKIKGGVDKKRRGEEELEEDKNKGNG